MNLYMGIEGAGMRSSLAVLSDERGHVLSAVHLRDESLSLHTTPRKAFLERLATLLTGTYHRAGLKLSDLQSTSVCMGITGVTFRYDRTVTLPALVKTISPRFRRLICTGDAEIAHAGYTRTMSGSALTCHSGSTAYIVVPAGERAEHFRFGGLGPAFGDEGSGYSMGRAVLRSIGEEHERRIEPPSRLWELIRAWLNRPTLPIPAWQEGSYHWQIIERDLRNNQEGHSEGIDARNLLFHFVHSMMGPDKMETSPWEGMELWRKIVSGLVIPLMQAWKEGDDDAGRIVMEAATSLATQYAQACAIANKTCGRVDLEPFVMFGGVFSHNPGFRELVLSMIRERAGVSLRETIWRSPGTMRPACGALLFALGNSATGDLRLPCNAIMDKVYDQQRVKPELQED